MLTFTPTQTRLLADLTTETLRYWKTVIGPLGKKRGHGAIFTLGDVIALKALGKLICVFGLQIGTLAPFADRLFEGCNSRTWSVSEEFFLLFDLEQNRVDLVPSLISSSIDGASVVLPLVPLIRDINHKLTADPLAGVQRILPFSAGRFQERQSG